jgi:hypothetical protein
MVGATPQSDDTNFNVSICCRNIHFREQMRGLTGPRFRLCKESNVASAAFALTVGGVALVLLPAVLSSSA